MATKKPKMKMKMAKRRGPKPEELRIEGEWGEAVARAVRKTPPSAVKSKKG